MEGVGNNVNMKSLTMWDYNRDCKLGAAKRKSCTYFGKKISIKTIKISILVKKNPFIVEKRT